LKEKPLCPADISPRGEKKETQSSKSDNI